MEIKPLSRAIDTFKEPLPVVTDNYNEAPLLTHRELMPGATGGDDDDPDLDLTFHANKVEFMVVQRDLKAPEKLAAAVLKDAANIDWTIPTQEEY